VSSVTRGCYGLGLPDWPGALEPLVVAESSWPSLRVTSRPAVPASAPATGVGRDRADVELIGGRLEMSRDPLEATFLLDRVVGADALVHPYLAIPAGIAGHWQGRQVFHGGAFVVGDSAWGVVADKEGGKSSTLAWLDRLGVDVLADDLLVIDHCKALAGPRCIDLRTETAAALGGAVRIEGADGRDRWRLRTRATATAAPFRGWIFLAWANEEQSFDRVAPSDRVSRVLAHRSVITVDADPLAFLDLASLPCIVFGRPHGLEQMGDAIEALLELLPR